MALIYGVDFRHNVQWIQDQQFFDDAEWREHFEICSWSACDRRAVFEFLGTHPFARQIPHVCVQCLVWMQTWE